MNSPSEISYSLDEKLELVATLYKGTNSDTLAYLQTELHEVFITMQRCFDRSFSREKREANSP